MFLFLPLTKLINDYIEKRVLSLMKSFVGFTQFSEISILFSYKIMSIDLFTLSHYVLL